MANDIIKVTVTEEGVVKLETDKISMPNHVLSENLVKEIGRVAGGTTTRKHKHGGKLHSHHHGEEHESHGH